MNELGFNDGLPIGNNTYKIYCNETASEIINRHTIQSKTYVPDFTNKVFVRQLPMIYGIPKMHKTPVKLRFISGCFNSSIKELSLLVKDILLHFKLHLFRYFSKIEERTGNRRFWSIDNTSKLHQFIKIENYKHTVKNMQVYCADFTSLFTNLPHDIVIKSIKYIISLCFKNALKTNSSVNCYITKHNSNWSYSYVNKNKFSFNFNDIIFLVNFILENSFIKFGPYIFKQILGIPQGNNASPVIADLTLLAMEIVFTDNIPQNITDKQTIIFRYMDDILIFYNSALDVKSWICSM
jgi:hypothetical protein